MKAGQDPRWLTDPEAQAAEGEQGEPARRMLAAGRVGRRRPAPPDQPAGGAPSAQEGTSVPPAGLKGQEFRDAVRRAQVARAAGQRGSRGRRAAAQARLQQPYRPGSNQRGAQP